MIRENVHGCISSGMRLTGYQLIASLLWGCWCCSQWTSDCGSDSFALPPPRPIDWDKPHRSFQQQFYDSAWLTQNAHYHQSNIAVTMWLKLMGRQWFTHSKHLAKHPHIEYKIDHYRSVHLTLTSKIIQPDFKDYMERIMKTEIEGNKLAQINEETNSVWVHLKGDNLGLIPYLCSNGFNIHNGAGQSVTLWRWISRQKDLVAPYCNFYISAGAILIKDDCILLVQERNGPRKGQYGIPGGRADCGESISGCSERQLLQETNIKASYSHILHFRELEKTGHGAMDIYFACVMKYDQKSVEDIRICERELSGYRWVHLTEYESFCKQWSVGTQFQLSKYISKLYKNGYDFKARLPNETTFESYISTIDRVERMIVQHGLVEGCKIDKLYSL